MPKWLEVVLIVGRMRRESRKEGRQQRGDAFLVAPEGCVPSPEEQQSNRLPCPKAFGHV